MSNTALVRMDQVKHVNPMRAFAYIIATEDLGMIQPRPYQEPFRAEQLLMASQYGQAELFDLTSHEGAPDLYLTPSLEDARRISERLEPESWKWYIVVLGRNTDARSLGATPIASEHLDRAKSFATHQEAWDAFHA